MNLRVLHISDLHFGPPFVPHVGEQILACADRLKPDVVVVSGDFTQRATVNQFRQAAEFVNRLPAVPRIVIPGNHDVPLDRPLERLLDPYRNYRQFIADELDSIVRVEGATFVGINSTNPFRAITNGRISSEQIGFTRQAFEQTADHDFRIVVAHHHLAPAPDYEGGEVMPKAKRALDAFSQMGVELILGGHLHRAYIGNSLDVYPGKNRDRGIIIVQSGTTTSRRGRAREQEKNSFNLLELTDDSIHIDHWLYFDSELQFAPVSRHTFPRQSARHFRVDR